MRFEYNPCLVTSDLMLVFSVIMDMIESKSYKTQKLKQINGLDIMDCCWVYATTFPVV